MPVSKWNIISVISWILGIVLLMYLATQGEFYYIFGFYTLAFIGFYGITRTDLNLKWILILGLFARGLIIGAFPNLSDDIFRFFWDGKLIWNGLNPYSYLPSEIDINAVSGVDESLFNALNSKDYYTVYPPLAQVIYFISSGAGIDVSVFMIRVMIITADILALLGMIKILDFLKLNKSTSALFFLNPLLIIEGVGNLHFEGIMVAALLWGIIYFFIKRMIAISSFLFSLAIGVKLLPLMFLPFFLGSKQKVKFLGNLVFFLFIIFIPVVWSFDIPNLWKSVDLYFSNFEFNASIYYLFREVGYFVSGYNLIAYIGPILAITTVGINLYLAQKVESYDLQSFLNYSFLVFVCYLFLATTVHPWYLILPLCMGVLSGYRWIVIWTFLIFLSYANYIGVGYYERLWVILLEYVLLWMIIWTEVHKKQTIF